MAPRCQKDAPSGSKIIPNCPKRLPKRHPISLQNCSKIDSSCHRIGPKTWDPISNASISDLSCYDPKSRMTGTAPETASWHDARDSVVARQRQCLKQPPTPRASIMVRRASSASETFVLRASSASDQSRRLPSHLAGVRLRASYRPHFRA